MNDLVSRQALLDTFGQWQKTEDYSNDEWNLLVDVLNVIKSMPPEPQLSTSLASLGTDCISRRSAIDALRGYLVEKRCPDDGTLTCRLIENEVINKLPSAEPKRGRWIGKYPVTSVCSECGFLIHDSKVKVFAYCPNCGAKMEVNHESN